MSSNLYTKTYIDTSFNNLITNINSTISSAIINVPTPINISNATNKKYVDNRTPFLDINNNYIVSSIPANTIAGSSGSSGSSIVSENTTLKTMSIGSNALSVNTGALNTGIGYSLNANTTGTGNTGIGWGSLASNITGTYNTAIGHWALSGGTAPTNNTVMGYQAFQNSNGSNSVTIGYQAQQNQNGGNSCVYIGSQAAQNCTSSNNVVIGYQAHKSGSGSGNMVIIGYQAGQIAGQHGHIFIGSQSGMNNAGNNNVCVGIQTMYNSTGGNNCTCLGSYSLFGTQSNNCTAVGYNSIQSSTGANNTAIGNSSGSQSTDTYTNYTCVGYQAQPTNSNQVVLGNSDTTVKYYSMSQISDMRDKTNIRETLFGLDFINKLNPVDYKFNYRSDYITYDYDVSGNSIKIEKENDKSLTRNRFHCGFLAQDLETIIAESEVDFGGFQDMKKTGGEDILSVNYIEFIAPIVKAIQEIDLKNINLTNQLNEALNKIDSLTETVNLLLKNRL